MNAIVRQALDQYQDPDPRETREWIESIEAILQHEGTGRAHELIETLVSAARRQGDLRPFALATPYVNTIPPSEEARFPGDARLEWRIRSIIRWNAMAMVVRCNRRPGKLGGHIASFGSSATLYDVGFNHFWRAPTAGNPGDLVLFQGHSSPGIYARSFVEGRITAAQMDNYRLEHTAGAQPSLASYPHPWLMPDYWRVPTVSCGLGPIQAIYQAQFWRYLQTRKLLPQSDRKVWCFLGDGEADEPESRGALSLAGREHLDNLIFVVNCNLQRLDGPVRGDGKVIQELEEVFRGAGWNVIKLIWGSYWDPLLARDTKGVLRKLMMETVDGEYQAYKALGGAYAREHFFGKYPETAAMVANLSDDDIWRLNRGGHDPHKVYAAYHAAVHTEGMPTVILAQTVKGYGMGSAGESMNIAHQAKKMHHDAIIAFRDRFQIPLDDKQLAGEDFESVPYYHPGMDSPEVKYMLERRRELGGFIPQRRQKSTVTMAAPTRAFFASVLAGSGGREISTTMAFVRCVNLLMRDRELAPRVVPIVVDEARTFGMEGMFRQIGIYAPGGQKYRPQDADQLMFYREAADGQVLQQGMTEAGGLASWIAAGTSYSVSDQPMLPVFLFYSFFGFRRVGDLILAAADQRTRGFLIGSTAGRAFAGEGLQHSDGSSHLMASVIPTCRAYDPAFGYEVALITQRGIYEMLEAQRDVFYYLTTTNHNYAQPPMPAGCEEGVLKGMYLYQAAEPESGKLGERPDGDAGLRVQLLGAGAILPDVLTAATMLREAFGIRADVWSCPSFNELARDGFAAERWNRLHPEPEARHTPYVTACLAGHPGPVIAASEYVRATADQIRAFIPAGRCYVVLGADGFGRSDTAEGLRAFFEIDAGWIAEAAVSALALDGVLTSSDVLKARELWHLDPAKPNPVTV